MAARAGALTALAGLVCGLLACRDLVAPARKPPYLAIVNQIVAPSQAAIGTQYVYHVRELSGTLGIDTLVVAAPRDTVILPLPPATYVVDLSGVPPTCKARNQGRAAVLIAPNTNTSIVRYFITCQSQLTVTVATDGGAADSLYVYHLTTSTGAQHLGLLRANDTLVFFQLAAGDAAFDLADVAANCDVTSDGGASRRIPIDSLGGAELDFRVVCSDPERRPHILSTHTTYHDGVGGLTFQATSPDRDVDRFVWDVTDCHRTSILPGGPRIRGGLAGGRTTNQDSITAVSAFEIGLPDSLVRGACAALWVIDSRGNMSPIVEAPIGSGGGRPPVAPLFNAHFEGPQILHTDLTVTDPDGDFLGLFVAYRLRDGVLGPPDGIPDLAYASSNKAGLLGDQVPDLLIGKAPFTYDNFYAMILYLFDAQGNFTRLEDADLFQ